METKIIEAHSPNGNWGKFLLCRMEKIEWERKVELPGVDLAMPLLHQLGWTHEHVWVLDLATGEGALFLPGGLAKSDLDKHKVWVCPLFEPFLEWLYEKKVRLFSVLPSVVELEAPFEFRGYRHQGLLVENEQLRKAGQMILDAFPGDPRAIDMVKAESAFELIEKLLKP